MGHTQGPWGLDTFPDFVDGTDMEVLDSDNFIIAKPELLEALKLAHAFLDSLPEGWLAHTTGDIGALNDFYIKSDAAFAKAAGGS